VVIHVVLVHVLHAATLIILVVEVRVTAHSVLEIHWLSKVLKIRLPLSVIVVAANVVHVVLPSIKPVL